MTTEKPDNRLFRRVPVRMPVKLLIENVIESKGVIISMSAGDMTIASRHPVKRGDEIVAYFNGRERLKGLVTRCMGSAFAVKMKLPRIKRRRIVEMLMNELAKNDGLINEDAFVSNRRVALRRKVDGRESICTLSNGDTVPCSVRDISLTGLGIDIQPVLKIGEIVRVGQISARVVRQTSNGYGLELIEVEARPERRSKRKARRANGQIAA